LPAGKIVDSLTSFFADNIIIIVNRKAKKMAKYQILPLKTTGDSYCSMFLINETGETMTTLEHLTITNFRGFDSLEIDDFSKINLFVGKNNSGKSSIPESIFLLIGMSNPILPNMINQIRGLNINTVKQPGYLFHNLSDENKPLFSARFSDSSERLLKLEAKYKQHESISNNASISKSELIELDLNFQEMKRLWR
jgi:hypothetical protein